MAREENREISQTALSEEEIMLRLKEKGLRMTEPRKLILNIVANEEFSCCKEVYVLAHKKNPNIGVATVYRMLNILEEIGAVKKKNIQKTACTGRCCDMKGGCTVVTEKSREIILSETDVEEALKYIMKKNGYANVDEIKAVLINQNICQC